MVQRIKAQCPVEKKETESHQTVDGSGLYICQSCGVVFRPHGYEVISS